MRGNAFEGTLICFSCLYMQLSFKYAPRNHKVDQNGRFLPSPVCYRWPTRPVKRTDSKTFTTFCSYPCGMDGKAERSAYRWYQELNGCTISWNSFGPLRRSSKRHKTETFFFRSLIFFLLSIVFYFFKIGRLFIIDTLETVTNYVWLISLPFTLFVCWFVFILIPSPPLTSRTGDFF